MKRLCGHDRSIALGSVGATAALAVVGSATLAFHARRHMPHPALYTMAAVLALYGVGGLMVAMPIIARQPVEC